jgi:hypothetical protein
MRLLKRPLAILAFVVSPVYVMAQTGTTGAIAGSVKDVSGAVVPGVTVEASSPVLIEKVRTVVTDAEGNYRIVDLRPGTYVVTFTLTGFNVVKREGIDLTSGFTANVNAELKVGEMSETLTVTGASPVVDVQNARTQQVLTRTLLDSMPTARQNTYEFAALTVGITVVGGQGQDVGGSVGEVGGAPAYHGSNGMDSQYLLDGMNFNDLNGSAGGSARAYHVNQLATSENNLGLGGQSAEAQTPGVQMNAIPRQGSNRFSGSIVGVYSGDKLHANNIEDALKPRGLGAPNVLQNFWDTGFALGGPIKQDKLWFFVSPHTWGQHTQLAGAYYNASANTPFYTPDLSNPAIQGLWDWDVTGRVTWQATRKDKLNFTWSEQQSCFCTYVGSSTIAPEFIGTFKFREHLVQGSWTRPQGNRLLFEGGISYLLNHQNNVPTGSGATTAISTIDAGTGQLYGSAASTSVTQNTLYDYGPGNESNPFVARFSTSYVTGSHAFKAGLQELEGWHNTYANVNQDLQYIFLNKQPIQLTEFAMPFQEQLRVRNVGLYAQDQWTSKKLTLNLGARFDYTKGWVLPQTIPAGSFVPQRTFGGVDDVPNFKDVSPRLAVVYDPFGKGKTAIKASFGRYVGSQGVGLAEDNNPALLQVLSASRTWHDTNGNYIPNCDFTNPNANGECGALSNNKFGTVVPGMTYADDVLHGWNKRMYSYQTSVAVQQELRQGLAATVGYYRTSYGNILAAVNQAVTPADFTTYCLTAPLDARLPGGGGNQVCGLYDVSPAKFGQVSTLITQASDRGYNITRVYNGVDAVLNGRFGAKATVTGGVGVGRTVADDCALNASPGVLVAGNGFTDGLDPAAVGGIHPLSSAYCHVAPPWSQSVQYKISGVYNLPYDVSVSGVFQNLPGIAVASNSGGTCFGGTCLTYANAQVAPALGRNLAAGPNATVVVPIVAPSVQYEDRLTQIDMRLTKLFKVGGPRRLRANVDLYNLLNANSITGENAIFGATYRNVTQIMSARYVKFGAQLDF